MEETSKLETGQIGSEFSLIPRSGYLRPIIPTVLYLAAFVTLEWSVTAYGLSEALGRFSLTAGLNLGLMLAYGLWYAPVVVIAIAADGILLHPFPFSMPVAMSYCLAVALVQVAAAASLRYLSSDRRVSLNTGADVAKFIGTGLLAALMLGAAATAPSIISGPFQWGPLLSQFLIRFTGFAAGIFCVTPVLLIHVAPWLETELSGVKGERQTLLNHIESLRANTQGTLFAVSFVVAAGLALYFILVGGISDRLYVFILLSIPLIWIAVRCGLEALSVAVPALLMITMVALVWVDGMAREVDSLLAILVVSSINAFIVGAGVTQSRGAKQEMRRRDAILEAVSYAARHFLGNTGWEAGVHEVARRIGEATAVTRVFLIDNRVARLGGQIGEASLYEWTHPSFSPDENEKRVLNLLRTQLIEDGSSGLSVGHPYLFRTNDLPRQKQEMLRALDIRSGVIIPMFVDRQWWGCLGL
jgi:hypothetical protein